MNFLYPLFLLLLPLASIPLILFTGFKGKKREVLFSTIFLLDKDKFRQERAKQKLKLWIIIIIRVMMILAIILLLARPRNFGKAWRFAYIDTSISMKELGKERVKNDLMRLFNIFGEKRVILLNTMNNEMFVKDSSEVPNMTKNDIFYTDGRISYEPRGKLICPPLHKNDAWIRLDSVINSRLYFHLHIPLNEVLLKIYEWSHLRDSFKLRREDSLFTYKLSGKARFMWFFIDYKDDLMENNYFFYIHAQEKIKVKLSKKLSLLSAFFSSHPFILHSNEDNCVSIDTIMPTCKRQVVFFNKKDRDFNQFIRFAKRVYFGRWYGYMVNSGERKLLFFDFYPYDTASQFYDVDFLKALSDTLKRMFNYDNVKKNLFIQNLDSKSCKGPIMPPGDNIISGFYVCNDDTIAINIDAKEYSLSSVCKGVEQVSFNQLRSIMLIENLLIYFLVLLFVLETVLLYIL